MSRWRIQAATTALLAVLVATTTSQPVRARDLQPFATGTPEQVGVSAERLGRITKCSKKKLSTASCRGRS
jgi:hypothetical protein